MFDAHDAFSLRHAVYPRIDARCDSKRCFKKVVLTASPYHIRENVLAL